MLLINVLATGELIMQRGLICSLVIAIALILDASTACADLPIAAHALPEIASWGVTVEYDAEEQLLTAAGSAGLFTRDLVVFHTIWGDSSMAGPGQFSLTATIDSDGHMSGGSVNISGWIDGISPPDPSASRLLLSASLAEFGYVFWPPSGDPFSGGTGGLQFGFIGSVQTVQGGDLASEFGGQDASMYALIGVPTMSESFSFRSDFAESEGGSSVHSIVPAPSSALILAFMTVGSVLFGIVRRRRR